MVIHRQLELRGAGVGVCGRGCEHGSIAAGCRVKTAAAARCRAPFDRAVDIQNALLGQDLSLCVMGGPEEPIVRYCLMLASVTMTCHQATSCRIMHMQDKTKRKDAVLAQYKLISATGVELT